MSKMNLLVFLNAYGDSNPSNAPSQNNFKWTKDINGMEVFNPISQSIDLAPGETKEIFSGTRTLSHDLTTVYNLTKKPLSSNTYVLKATSGTLPNFRTPRSIGIDATTEIEISTNSPLMIITSIGGTLFNLTSVQVGDFIRLGTVFNSSNQGEFKILSKTSNSITVENFSAYNESSVILGVTFNDQIQIYSAAGVQKNDTLIISGGFSSVSQNSYKITDVAANYLEFYFTSTLPEETGIITNSLSIYSIAKQLIYLESDNKIKLIINGTSMPNDIEPLINGNSSQPGMFLMKSTIYSLSIINSSTNTANVFFASVE